MPLSLHAALVPGWLQVLGSVRRLIDKAQDHCAAHGIADDELIGARLIDDMQPLAYQIKSCHVHSAGAIEGLRTRRFSPDWTEPPATFAGLAARIDEAISLLGALDPAELDELASGDIVFTIGEKLRMDFTAQNFLLGFSQPNFYFHAATTYDILRMKGLAIGKRDYLGVLPIKR